MKGGVYRMLTIQGQHAGAVTGPILQGKCPGLLFSETGRDFPLIRVYGKSVYHYNRLGRYHLMCTDGSSHQVNVGVPFPK